MTTNCASKISPFSCDYVTYTNSSNCSGCSNVSCGKCVPDFLETQNRIYACCAINGAYNDVGGICNTLACPTGDNSAQIAASKMLTLKRGPNYIGTSQKMNYARQIKTTPGTYTFASKKYPYKQVNTGTNLSMVGSPQNWCTIQNPRSAQYASIGANVQNKMQCFTGSDVCALPVETPFLEFCYKKCLRPSYSNNV